ncbi:MAG TPA: DNA helicase RecG, partial [Candidatus Polarisedimenticolia bacterium]|nr:DNA helicase RecG [Candidatus Polarisedimenticolia bacterium]
MIRPDDPLASVAGIGPRRAQALEEAGLRTVEDLLLHLPHRYEDRSAFLPIAGLAPGIRATVRGRIVTAALRRTRARGFTIFEAVVEDDSGPIRVIFFNQPYLRTVLTRGREVILFGEATPARFGRRGLVLESPQIEIVSAADAEAIHTGRVVPIHPRLPGMSARLVRSTLHRLLRDLAPDLPD